MKIFQLNKSYSYILITLLCLIFLGASYFFIYLPKNQRWVEDQRFNTLQNIDRNIHNKIDNSIRLLRNTLNRYNENNNNGDLKNYIKNYPKDNFYLSLKTEEQKQKNLNDTIETEAGPFVNDNTKEITLLYTIAQSNIPSFKDSILHGSVKYTINQFIENLLPSAVFDEYIVFKEGNPIYESFPSGIGKTIVDSMLSSNNQFVGTSAKDITIGGKDYKLFLQQVTFNNKNKWVVGGLLLKSRYLRERAKLPAEIILLLITALLAMIVVFPWIKLYQMGSRDRLTFVDGASSIVAAMLLMSLLFFCFFKYNATVKEEKIKSPDSKKILANKISKAFYNETKQMDSLLKVCDLLRKNSDTFNVTNLLGDENIAYNRNGKKDTNNSKKDNLKPFLNSIKNLKIDQFFWMDSTGLERYNWTSGNLNAPHGNYKDRNYFKYIINNKPYYLETDTNKYYLDQVVSWISGTFQTVISIPTSISKDTGVAAVSFTMRSVQDVVMPTGYSFAIIDNSGEVLYHSFSSRNLNENVKFEFSDSSNISSCINARAVGEFSIRYHSKNYSVNVTPIDHLPYFIIIFSDSSYKDVKDVETYSFTFSMLLLTFLYFVLQLCTTLLISSRRSFFKKQLYDTSWIGPKTFCHKVYVSSSCINILLILLLIVCFQITSFLLYLFLLLFVFVFIPLFLNILFAIQYLQEDDLYKHNFKFNFIFKSIRNFVFGFITKNKTKVKYNYKYKFKETAIKWLLVLLVVINIAAIRLLASANFLILLLIEIGAGIVAILFIRYAYSIALSLPKKIRTCLLAQHNYIKSFSFMLLTALIITSGIPVAFYYVASYNYEQNLGIRQRQTDYALRLLNQPNFKFSTCDTCLSQHQFSITDTTGIYYDGSWVASLPTIVDSTAINKIKNTTEYPKKKEESNISRYLLGAFHFNIGDNSFSTDKLYMPYAADTSVIYQPLLINTTTNSGVSTYKQTDIPNKYLQLNSYNLSYTILNFFKGFSSKVYWISLLALIIVFYFVIINILKKMFCLNLPNLNAWEDIDTKLLTDTKLNRLLFMIGLPGAGKFTCIKEKLKNGDIKFERNGLPIIPLIFNQDDKTNNNVFEADLINIPDTGPEIENDKGWQNLCAATLDDRYRLIIINHFEYNIQDEYTNLAKLNLLEKLMLKNAANIIILSTIHPMSFLDSLSETVKKTDSGATPKPVQDLERWNVLLGHYRITLLPLIPLKIKKERENKLENEKLKPVIKTVDKNKKEKIYNWQQLIARETEYTHFLQDMEQATFEVAEKYLGKTHDDIMNRTDELAYKLQVTSHYFYMYIWQSLTKEEKFLLYDLAEDNLVNSYDNYNLTMLIAKGIIVHLNGSLQFFNRGFKNFILTAIGNTEVLKIKERINENGNWSNLKTPLIIVILAILAFLLISQQEAYSKLITYVAALSAGVPTILKIFSLFDKNASKANA